MSLRVIEVTPKVVWVAVTTIAALIASSAGATWAVRKDYIDDLNQRIDAYEKSNSWKLPQTLTAIRNASNSLSLDAKERKELTELRKEVAASRQNVQQLHAKLTSANSELRSAREAIAKVNAPVFNFELGEGASRFLVPNLVNVALKSAFSTAAQIRLANQEQRMELGETVEYEGVNSKKCHLTLVKLAMSKAVFQAVC